MSKTSDPVRQHIDQVKSLLNLRDYARDFLGIEVDGADKSSCLFHLGEKIPSLHFYATNYHCFSCEENGDFISLQQAIHPDQSFLEIIDDASGFVGMGPCPRGDWTEEEVAIYRKDIQARKRLEELFMVAADYFVDCAEKSDMAQTLLHANWGLEPDFCKRKKIGYCPDGRTDLLNHLVKKGFSLEEAVASGLVSKYIKEGEVHYAAAFRGRIIFPYWIGSRIVYFIGRSTPKTPKPPEREPPKYKKLRVWKESDSSDEESPLAKHVKNWLYGMDYLYDSRYPEIIITEGIADAMKAEQHGIPVVSPVTTRLKEKDFEAFVELFANKQKIYIINDNEESHAGEKGALDIAMMLEAAGCNVRIGIIPRPEGVEKIDLADLMRMNSDPVEAVERIKKDADIPLVHIIKQIDPEADEMERNEQILSLEGMWNRVHAAQIPAVIELVKAHFGMKAKQANALEAAIKKMQKEAAKEKSLEEAKKAAEAQQDDITNMPLKIRIGMEIEAEGQTPAVGMRIYEWAKDWLIQNGAKFYRLKRESRGIMYFKRKLYDISTIDFQLIMDEVAGFNPNVQVHKVAMRYLKNHILRTGKRIDDLTWITTLDNGVKYLSLTDLDGDKIIRLDPKKDKVEIVYNGDNQDDVILRAPVFMKDFEYDPNITTEEGMRLFESLIFKPMTCDIQDRYFVTAWNMLPFFVDNLGTRPILHFAGDPGSGKTTTSKMLSILLYGVERHESGSTMAATYDSSSCTPCVYWDNKEQGNLKEAEQEFLIASVTGATRQKKSGLGTGEIVLQIPQSMILSTSVEIFRKEELIQRTLILDFHHHYRQDGFSEERFKSRIQKYRNSILSAMLNIAHKVHKELQDEEYYDWIEDKIRQDYPDNAKSRSMTAFVHMWVALKEICKYIRHSYVTTNAHGDEVEVNFDFDSDYENIHHKVFGTWIFQQTSSHNEVVSASNEVLYFLDTLYQEWNVRDIDDEEDAASWLRDKERRFREQYHVTFANRDGFDYLMCEWHDLHYAFGQISNTSIRYSINSSANLSKRIRSIRDILHKSGWAIATNVRKVKGRRKHLLLPDATPEKMQWLEDKYDGNIEWLHKSKLRVIG